MKRYFILLLFTSINYLLYSQGIGDWVIHSSYHYVTKSVAANDIVYVLSKDLSRMNGNKEIRIGSLYSYDHDDNSIITYDKSYYLNDNNIINIAYNNTLKTLLIAYENSNIDLLINDNEVYNIPDFMHKTMTEDKSLNNISIYNNYAYLSTNFGILLLDMKKKEISNTYNLNLKVFNTVLYENIIYAATEAGIFAGDINKNLLDKSNWENINNTLFDDLLLYKNTLIGNKYNDGIYKYNISSNTTEKFNNGSYTYMDVSNGKLVVGNSRNIIIHTDLDSKINLEIQNDNLQHFSYWKNDNYWGCNGINGLNGYKLENNNLIKTVESIIPEGPKNNLSFYMTFTDRLLLSGGGIWTDRFSNPGTIMEFKEGEWSSLEDGEDIFKKTGLLYQDITSIAQNPNDPEHIFATAAGEGLYEFKKGKLIKLHNIDNSILETIYPGQNNQYNYIRMNGLKYDKSGNLWMLNSRAQNTIKIFKNDSTWMDFHHSDFHFLPTAGHIVFDKRGWAWATSLRSQPGIFCFNTNNTLQDTNDDKTVFRKSFTNQDGEILSPDFYYCITEDKNGAIWIGTNQGPFIINNPTKIFDNDFYCTQIKVPRNDGTNSADLLLVNEYIRAIAIDGANRKWIGTENSGVYLISEDGLKTIHHFTTENSPLISNFIYSISIDPKNGIVYISTDKGLVSYRSDATEAEASFSEDTYAFPNPVRPDYEGLITVTGLVRDSDVKIVDGSGYLVYSGTSLGGQFTWNGKNSSGKRVASGVYFVLASDAEGKEGIATKILMIK